jgi:hypothetical protein
MTFTERYSLLTLFDKFIIGFNIAAGLMNFGDWLWMLAGFAVAVAYFFVITDMNKKTREGRQRLAMLREEQDRLMKQRQGL